MRMHAGATKASVPWQKALLHLQHMALQIDRRVACCQEQRLVKAIAGEQILLDLHDVVQDNIDLFPSKFC